jgi:hypothetical protein
MNCIFLYKEIIINRINMAQTITGDEFMDILDIK